MGEPGPTTKQRTPSRCREWERQRRIKFNEAISKLGEIVKSINKANNDQEADNVQYPKIEIVQKAIICLTNCVQEKTQLKADILALEVKLEAIEKQKHNKRDVSIQVTLAINKKSPHSKCVKLVMNQNTKIEKTVRKTKIINKCPPPNLPKLLPITNLKKENTIVMLPATPYIFPQRPVLIPQGPTFVLVDTNLQPLNKPTTIPIINRNANDITKTTMVNVLPISAYSHPLSAKTKKNNPKSRNGTSRKSVKKVKLTVTNKKEENVDGKEKPSEESVSKNDDISSNDKKAADAESAIEMDKETIVNDKPKSPECDKLVSTNDTLVSTNETNIKTTKCDSVVTLNNITNPPKCSDTSITKSNHEPIASLPNITAATEKITTSVAVQQSITKCSKIILPDKNIIESEYKNKDNKIQAIIDSTICENAVDAGNARLELAEELLAASPTAAFLMSFPLVSGNRADSPADEAAPTANAKETPRRNESHSQQISYFDKPNVEIKNKTSKSHNTNINSTVSNTVTNKPIVQQKYETEKSTNSKSTPVSTTVTTENPFLNLPLPSVIPSSCTLNDSNFALDFDCNVTKAVTSQPTTFSTTTNNIFYKGDPFNSVKNTIYSTSSITSGHEFNSLGLYACAMENYAGKNKSEYSNVEDNLMKINSSRLTYDIDLGWSHKSFDFVNCTTGANTFHKDNILTTSATPFSTTYNPFNPEFHVHVPLVSNSNKKNPVSKVSTFPEQITSLYSQTTNLWPEDVSSIYTNGNVSRNSIPKQQNYFGPENLHSNMNAKTAGVVSKQFDNKNMIENSPNIVKSSPVVDQHMVEKYTKKSPNKMHINWMTSEIRPLQNNCNQNHNLKEPVKIPYTQIDQVTKKTAQTDSSYFPINMHNFPTQPNHDDLQVWPTARPAGTTEISIEPPPINLPTLVGDLALGPHDKKKGDIGNRILPHTDLQTCGNFLSVTQLMNRSSDNIMPPRSNGPMNESQKPLSIKQNLPHNVNESNRKAMPTRLETHPQICYGFNESKVSNPYENINQFSQTKSKSNNKSDKNTKVQKNNYSAEALIRGGTTCNQKLQDNTNIKSNMGSAQKYNDFNVVNDSGVAQVSHFPPILDYSDNTYPGQQFSGTTLYNSTTNTISNSFYSNFIPGSSNLMTGNYAGGSFSSDFVDYSQVTECNYSNPKYNEIKMKNNAGSFQPDKESNYKSSRRESVPKHKLECSKKESSKKYQSKRPKIANEVEEWNESHLLWQNKPPAKRNQNLMSEELPFSNYVGNQMPTQYQPDYFNSHIMQSNIQNVGSNADRSLSSFPVASRANFNLSALFPEITMKVQ